VSSVPVVAIVGRTNVGKSTLFNTLAGRRIAVVEDEPGVTRDRHYQMVTKWGFPFTLIDTGGLVGDQDEELQSAVTKQALLAIKESDAVIAVFDGKAGVHPLDEEVVRLLRRSTKPVIWVGNKTEKEHMRMQANELYALGIEPLLFVSAAQSVGIKELVATLKEVLAQKAIDAQVVADVNPGIRLAIVGRPNVGKSTLVNRLVGEERVVASSKPGTTRDAIDVTLMRNGQKFTIVDTAGLRRKSKVEDDGSERYSNIRALNTLSECDVAVLLLDATQGLPSDQDIRIGTLIHERGRAFIIVVNKWDAIEKDTNSTKEYEQMVRASFLEAPYAPILFVSGLTGQRAFSVLDMVLKVSQESERKISGEELYEALQKLTQRNVPPVYHGAPIRFYRIEQTGVKPHNIVIHVNHPRGLTPSYIRYLRSALREIFPLVGCDLKLYFRKRGKRAEEQDPSGESENEDRDVTAG